MSGKLAKNLAEILLHFLAPVSCPVCGKPAEIICPECAKRLFADEVISRSVEGLKIFSAAWYHTDINKLIAAFKYADVRSLCRPLGRAMAEFLPKPKADFLVPIPLHIKSKRNYNQALELAKGVSDVWKLEIFHGAAWSSEIPNRAGLNAHERMKLKSDAFIIANSIKNFNVAIIDDVCTTGMTLLRFSQACEFVGARVVGAYTLAAVSEI
ncbi:MAG: ComF family protein [Synergistaceae bacterium]|nr:ComF family protein [Synergistaceae bacterium]